MKKPFKYKNILLNELRNRLVALLEVNVPEESIVVMFAVPVPPKRDANVRKTVPLAWCMRGPYTVEVAERMLYEGVEEEDLSEMVAEPLIDAINVLVHALE